MKETQEFTGKDVDAAVKNACTALGISKNDLKYEIIVAGTSGIFGIVGRKDAKIKVTLPTKKETTSAEEMEGIRSIVDEAFGKETRKEPKSKPKDSKPKEQKPREPKKEIPLAKEPEPEFESDDEEEDDFYVEEEAFDAEDDTEDEEDSGRWDKDSDLDDGGDEDDDEDEDEEDDDEPRVPVSQEAIDLGIEAVQKMADLITDDAKIEAVTDQDRLTLQITGGNAGILIGRKGQTLDAMQFLADKIINRKSEARVRVKVDIEGYMETRKANLQQLAFKMAEKAKKTGRPATINQMSAQDRRIVHLALKDDSQVRTQSMGDGYYRRLVIFPKKRSSYRGKRRFKRNDR